MYSGDFWSLKWFWFLHLGESRWWGAALSHGWSHRHGRGCNAFPWPFHVSMAAVYPLPDTSRAPVGHLKAFNSAFRSARNFCWKSWHMWRGECWKRGQALKIQCLWQTLDTLGTHLPKNSFGTEMMRDFWARCPKDVEEDFDRLWTKKCLKFFACTLLLWPCHHSALAWLACSLHLRVGGGPDTNAQSRSESEMERETISLCKNQVFKTILKAQRHQCTCVQKYIIYIYIHISSYIIIYHHISSYIMWLFMWYHVISCDHSFHGMHMDASCFPVHLKRALGSAGQCWAWS